MPVTSSVMRFTARALQVAGYTGYILDTLVRHDVRVFSLVHYRVLAWVKFLHQTEADPTMPGRISSFLSMP